MTQSSIFLCASAVNNYFCESHLAQPLLQIGNQVIYMLNADRKPQQALGRTEVRRLNRSAMLDGAFSTSQAAGPPANTKPRGCADRLFASAVYQERKQPTELLHLLPGNIVARVRLESGIKGFLHRWMAGQKFGNRQGIFCLGAHPQTHSADSAMQKPAIKRRGDRSARALDHADLLKESIIFTAYNCSAQYVAVSAKIFGRGVHHHVSPQLEASLQNRSADVD